MIPTYDVILNTIGTNLTNRYLPQTIVEAEKADLALMAFLLAGVSEEFERAAHRRIEENIALRNLFRDALPIVKNNHLKSRLESASKIKETDWRISSLNDLNNQLLELLIELHAYVEKSDDKNSRKILTSIWEELRAYAKRREFKINEISQAMLLEARKSSD